MTSSQHHHQPHRPLLVELGIETNDGDDDCGGGRRCDGGADGAAAAASASAVLPAASTSLAVRILRRLLLAGTLSERDLRDAAAAVVAADAADSSNREPTRQPPPSTRDDEKEETKEKTNGNDSGSAKERRQQQQEEVVSSSSSSGGQVQQQQSGSTVLSAALADTADGTAISGRRKRHIALRIYYDGSEYTGLAEMVGRPSDNSIEKAFFEALLASRLIDPDGGRSSVQKYSRCGRTDRGVSANGQVLALQVNSAFALSATLDEEGRKPLLDEDLPKNAIDTVEVWTVPRQTAGDNNTKKKKRNKNNQKKAISAVAKDDNDDDDNDMMILSSSDHNAAATAAAEPSKKRTRRVMTEYAYDKILSEFSLLPPSLSLPVSLSLSALFPLLFSFHLCPYAHSAYLIFAPVLQTTCCLPISACTGGVRCRTTFRRGLAPRCGRTGTFLLIKGSIWTWP